MKETRRAIQVFRIETFDKIYRNVTFTQHTHTPILQNKKHGISHRIPNSCHINIISHCGSTL